MPEEWNNSDKKTKIVVKEYLDDSTNKKEQNSAKLNQISNSPSKKSQQNGIPNGRNNENC